MTLSNGIIGIDLGTTASVVAIYNNGQPSVIASGEGKRLPSLIAFNRNGEASVGFAARRQAVSDPTGVVHSLKRLLGRPFDDPVVQLVYEQQPFSLRRTAAGGVEIVRPGSGRAFSPAEGVALILRKLKQEAEASLGAPVRQVVLTAPAHFNQRQRQALRHAAELAELDVLQVINEPAAAAIAYGARHPGRKKLLVVDLGGGHYDVSALEIDDGSVTVYATDGDPSLGCQDWDAAIADYFAGEFLRHHGVDLKSNHHSARRLRNAAKEARKELSRRSVTTINLPFISSGVTGPRHLNMSLTRQEFEAQTASLRARLAAPIRRTLEDANLAVDALESVVLVGGGSHMPAVRELIREIVGQTPMEDVAAENLVALGAAMQAGRLAGEAGDVPFQDVTPLSLGLETMGGLMTTIVPRNTSIPVRRSEVFGMTEDGQTDIKIRVLQGERSLAEDNNELGVIHLQDISAAPRGAPQIEVTFEIDGDGKLHVSARDLASGASHVLSVAASESIADVEVQRLVKEAETHEVEDVRKRTLVEARNLARQLIYQTERSLQYLNGISGRAECGEKRKEVTTKLETLQKAIDEHDVQKIRKLTVEIQEASIVLNQLAYGLVSKSNDNVQPDLDRTKDAAGYREITIETL